MRDFIKGQVGNVSIDCFDKRVVINTWHQTGKNEWQSYQTSLTKKQTQQLIKLLQATI